MRKTLRRLTCLLFGHRYFVIERFSSLTRKVGCHRCLATWGMHDGVEAFVPWDGELEAFHSGVWP